MRKTGIEKNITCPLCKGYLIDTVTLRECTHFFCRRCFLLHLQKETTCPACATKLTDLKTAFFRDDVLQNLVYKLTPATYWREVELRADFIEKRVVTAEERRQIADLNLIQFQQHLIEKNELVEFCMAYITPKSLAKGDFDGKQSPPEGRENEEGEYYKKYFRCKAVVALEDLKEIILAQVELPKNIVIVFIHEGSREVLLDKYTLQDVVYLFGWDRLAPLRLFFTPMDVPSPAMEDEEKPPVLEMECSFDQREESMKSPPPLEQPEERVDVFPALTVNLSTAQCIPDMTLNGGTGTRVPIITQASQTTVKKRRRNGPKKEKAPKKSSKQMSTPNSTNIETPAFDTSSDCNEEWRLNAAKKTKPSESSVVPTNSIASASNSLSAAPQFPKSPGSSTPPSLNSSSSMLTFLKQSPSMLIASLPQLSSSTSRFDQSVPTCSNQSSPAPMFAKPDSPMSIASFLSSSPLKPMSMLSNPMFSNALSIRLSKEGISDMAPEKSFFLPTTSKQRFAMPLLLPAVPPSKPLKAAQLTIPRFSMPLLSLPESHMAVSPSMETSQQTMSTQMPVLVNSGCRMPILPSMEAMSCVSMTKPAVHANPQLSKSKTATIWDPTTLPISSPDLIMSSVQVSSLQPCSSSASVHKSNSQTSSISVLSRRVSCDTPSKQNNLMPTFSMPPLSSEPVSPQTIASKMSLPLTNPLVTPLKSSKPTSYKIMPKTMKTGSSINPKPYEKLSPKKKMLNLSPNMNSNEYKEKSMTCSILEPPPRPFIMPRPVSPDTKDESVSSSLQVPKNGETTIGVPEHRSTTSETPNAKPTNVNDDFDYSNSSPPTKPVSNCDRPKKTDITTFALKKEPQAKSTPKKKSETTSMTNSSLPLNKDAQGTFSKDKSVVDNGSFANDTNKTLSVKTSANSTSSKGSSRPSVTKQRSSNSVNKSYNMLRNLPPKNIGSSIIPIMTDRVPLLTASKAGR